MYELVESPINRHELLAKFLRLERENAALRAENAALREQIQILSGENRRLRQVVAAPAMITWAMHGKDLP